MLEHTTEGDDLAPTLIDAITDNLIHRIVGRGNIGEGAISCRLLHSEVLDIEAIVHLEVIAHMRHVKGIEAGLRLRQSRLHLRGLEHLRGMVGRHTERLSAIHDILTQSEGQ